MSGTGDPASNPSDRKHNISDVEMELVRQSLAGLVFGSVSIVIQDGVVVQIDRTEKRRLRVNELGTRPRTKQ